MTNRVSFDIPTRDRFRKAYEASKEMGLETFWFDGNEYVVAYVKYLLEYLDKVLGK